MTHPPQAGQPWPYGQDPRHGPPPQQGWPPASPYDQGTQPQQPPQPPTGGHPRHGAYPQQPDPYNRAGYPHPGNQPPGWMPPGGGYGPGYGAPPPKKRTGLWVGLGAGGLGVAVIAALLITGFVAPGFFLGGNDPDEVATTFVEGWNDRDPEPMNAVICQQGMLVQRGMEPTQELLDTSEMMQERVTLTGEVTEESDSRATVPMEIATDVATDNPDVAATLVLGTEGGDWCVDNIE
ncbi:hypothetical protein H0B56_18415 [Haloechinothrix sp. YIM 98757]|uniref:DUF4878 domain-containing protein n=1 Tax=Haloechinothrix aidingensis TaxID=2752311 RepID=A0A838AE67_9PSEU|nr:hypothetical protein [Haloechinothrix aidingensis]MBA0127523.1 hypothetical protein [Haloechinothrix aidingensis]